MAIRATQIPTQVGEAPTDAKARATQLAIETAQAPTTARLRASQLVLLIAEGKRLGMPFGDNGHLVSARRFI
jgi:hypothetical protein